MSRIFHSVLGGSLLCAFIAGVSACSDGSGMGSNEQGGGKKLGEKVTTPPVKTDEKKSTANTTANKGEGKQDLAPVEQLKMVLVAVHVLKDDPTKQMAVYHYCQKMTGDMIQCALYNDGTKEAKLIGTETIIPGSAFASLPEEEKQYWHPNNYEVLSGLVVAPGMSDADELALMKSLMNSYGKTYQFWDDTGTVALGASKLSWTVTKDEEVKHDLLSSLGQKLGVDLNMKKEARKSLEAMVHEQEGASGMTAPQAGAAPKAEPGKEQPQEKPQAAEQPQQAQAAPQAAEKPQAAEQPQTTEKPQAAEQPQAQEQPQKVMVKSKK